MSQISITGASTGTATFTLESPATSTNRTLTLPDNTGTIITQNSTPAFASTIGVGGATAAASGAGITFPATQSASSDANTLDDYEEGSWTPTVRGSGTAGTYELQSVSGTYVKIGKQVTIIADINFAGSITGGGTGYLQITGVPFANALQAVGPCTQNGLDMGANYTWLSCLFIGASQTILFLRQSGDNQAADTLPISGVSANDNINICVTYWI